MTNLQTLLLAALVAASLAPAPAAKPGDCILPITHPERSERIGPYDQICKTYFLGAHVYTSTEPCQASIRHTPEYVSCTFIPSSTKDCEWSGGGVMVTTQGYKGQCDAALGLSIQIGGVEIFIDWWEAKCKKAGAPIVLPLVGGTAKDCETPTAGVD